MDRLVHEVTMFKEASSLRNFKGGSWDLRKDERRKSPQRIAFPERRLNNRRDADRMENQSITSDVLRWVSKSKLDA